MRIRVSYIVEVDDKFRRAWRKYYGEGGLATRGQLQVHFREHGASMDDDILADATCLPCRSTDHGACEGGDCPCG